MRIRCGRQSPGETGRERGSTRYRSPPRQGEAVQQCSVTPRSNPTSFRLSITSRNPRYRDGEVSPLRRAPFLPAPSPPSPAAPAQPPGTEPAAGSFPRPGFLLCFSFPGSRTLHKTITSIACLLGFSANHSECLREAGQRRGSPTHLPEAQRNKPTGEALHSLQLVQLIC